MAKEYVHLRDGAWRLTGSRVTLDSLVELFREGVSVEAMVESYPTLSVEQVYGAITFYLADRSNIDQYLEQGRQEAERASARSCHTNAELIAKLKRARAVSPQFARTCSLSAT